MKLYFSTVIMSYAFAIAKGSTTGSAIQQKWALGNPTTDYAPVTNTLTMTYKNVADSIATENLQFEFYDENCKTDKSDPPQYVLVNGIDSPVLQKEANEQPTLSFKLIPAVLAKDVNIYTPPSTDANTDNKGVMKMCARTSVGYNEATPPTRTSTFVKTAGSYCKGTRLTQSNGFTSSYVDADACRQECLDNSTCGGYYTYAYGNDPANDFCVIYDSCEATSFNSFYDAYSLVKEAGTSSYKEINFVETLVTVNYSLKDGSFTVIDVAVAPKEKETTSESKDSYKVEASLCTNPQQDPFEQGSLICVTVKPDQASLDDGIVMKSIDDFTWKRDDDGNEVTQEAITGANVVSTNELTSIDCSEKASSCSLSSVLKADFYKSTGTVTGTGSATMMFNTPSDTATRALMGGSVSGSGRVLQEAAGAGAGAGAGAAATSEFDIAIPVGASDDDVGALKTAAGAGASTSLFSGSLLFASIAVAGLVGAVLSA